MMVTLPLTALSTTKFVPVSSLMNLMNRLMSTLLKSIETNCSPGFPSGAPGAAGWAAAEHTHSRVPNARAVNPATCRFLLDCVFISTPGAAWPRLGAVKK